MMCHVSSSTRNGKRVERSWIPERKEKKKTGEEDEKPSSEYISAFIATRQVKNVQKKSPIWVEKKKRRGGREGKEKEKNCAHRRSDRAGFDHVVFLYSVEKERERKKRGKVCDAARQQSEEKKKRGMNERREKSVL